MSTIAFVFALALVGLIVLSKIPGLEYLVKPLIDLFFGLVKFCAEHGVSWVIYITKVLFSSHIEFVRHLALSAESVDPSQTMREQK